jgi:hypothetical protein
MPLPPRRSLLEQYRGAGLHDSVWHELIALGPLEPGTPPWAEAAAIARETMERVRRNLEAILAGLAGDGYVFGTEDTPGQLRPQPPWTPPPPETPAQLAELERRVGPVPLSLRAWWEQVGAVSLQGAFPDTWAEAGRLPMNDPLVVDSLAWVLEQADEWEGEGRVRPFKAWLAPDLYHKANVSGGAPYTVALPDGRADAPLDGVVVLLPNPLTPGTGADHLETKEFFVEYLRRSFRWAGFPGYAAGGEPAPDRDLDRLRPLVARMVPL